MNKLMWNSPSSNDGVSTVCVHETPTKVIPFCVSFIMFTNTFNTSNKDKCVQHYNVYMNISSKS